MADRQSAPDLTALAQLRTVLTQRAADEARRAADHAELCRTSLAAAEHLSEASLAAWSAHLAGPRFDPAIGLLLAADAVSQDRDLARRRAEHDRSNAEATTRQTRFERAIAEEKVGKALLISARRRAERERDERRLSVTGDLVTIRWGQR